LQTLVGQHKLLWEKGEEKDILGFFSLYSTLLVKLGKDAVSTICDDLIHAVDFDSKNQTALRTTILGNFYNIHTDPEWRFKLFRATLEYVLAANEVEFVTNELDSIDDRLKEWNSNDLQKRQLYKLAWLILERVDSASEGYRKFTNKYLNSFESSPKEDLSAAKGDAKKAITLAIKGFYQFDQLLNYAVIKNLASESAEYQEAYTLLQIFAAEKLESYLNFYDKNTQFFQSEGLDHNYCLKKIKLLTLVSLASANSSVPYAHIAQELKIDEDQVETWVITAITENLIDAKIDQRSKTVYITRALHRVFTTAQWKELKTKLTQWKKNVNILLQSLQNVKEEKT